MFYLRFFDNKQIRALRQQLGLTATEFAYRVGVSENTVRRWELGDRHPRREAIIKLNRLADRATAAEATAAR